MSALIRAKAENGPKFGGEYRARARLLVPMYDLRRYGANRSFFFFFFFFFFFPFACAFSVVFTVCCCLLLPTFTCRTDDLYDLYDLFPLQFMI